MKILMSANRRLPITTRHLADLLLSILPYEPFSKVVEQ
jgi:hypothetical protein